MQGNIEVRVYYEDTDCLGVVYYANYLKYFERGRTELIGGLSRDIGLWNAEAVNFAVYKCDVTYHKPARLGDICRVQTTVLAKGSPYRLQMDQKLFRGDERLTSALVQLVCLDADFSPREFPDEILALREQADG